MENLSYVYPVKSLVTGSSLGNPFAFAQIDAETNLRGLWCSLDNEFYAGGWEIDIEADGKPLEAKETLFRPESQSTMFRDDAVEVEKTCVLPFASMEESDPSPTDLLAVVFLVKISNRSASTKTIILRHTVTIPAVRSDLFTKAPPPEQTNKRASISQRGEYCEISTLNNPKETRVFGATIAPDLLVGNGGRLAVRYRVELPAQAVKTLSFVLAFSPEGPGTALQTFRNCLDGEEVFRKSRKEYDLAISRSLLVTPLPVINRGLQWAKVNMLRVQHCYKSGKAFTNDPPQDIVVVRDVGWYVIGSDYVTPRFSHDVLRFCDRHAYHENGKLTEYVHANEEKPGLHDYGLNINDDTPLFVLAHYHHALLCEQDDWETVYAPIKQACEYILSQVSDGLVRCHATGTGVEGICGWRNIIEGYNLSGAVTEINAECYRALSLAGEVAAHLGKSGDAQRFGSGARALRDAINSKLVSERTGLCLLALGDDGTRHHDITGDLVFPLLFSVADENMRGALLKRLLQDDLWTPFGARTVSSKEPGYDPDFGYQLVGGVWPNLTAWIGFCARDGMPEKTVDAMEKIYKISETGRPGDYGFVVPGEFPERLHGETFASRGMTMSPWTPPTYLWLGVEGLMGIKPGLRGLEINPAIPRNWRWIGMKNVPYKGKSLSAILCDGTLFTSHPVQSRFPMITGEEVPASSDNEKIFCLGLKQADSLIVIACSAEAAAGSIHLRPDGVLVEVNVSLKAGESKILRLPHGVNAPSSVKQDSP